MHGIVLFVRLAAITQVAIAIANLFLPRLLRYDENLRLVSPIIRQIFIVHSVYIVGVLLIFAGVSFGFPSELTSGRGLGQFLAGTMAIFWLCRAPLQLFYYDRVIRRSHRSGDAAFIAATFFLAATYSFATFATRL